MQIKINRKIRDRLNKVANAAGCATIIWVGVVATKMGGASDPTTWSIREHCGEAALMSEATDPKNPMWRELDLIALSKESSAFLETFNEANR